MHTIPITIDGNWTDAPCGQLSLDDAGLALFSTGRYAIVPTAIMDGGVVLRIIAADLNLISDLDPRAFTEQWQDRALPRC